MPSLLFQFVRLLKSCTLPLLSYSEDLAGYPITSALEKMCEACDESAQRRIVPLLGIIYAERFVADGSLDLSNCNESIQSTLLESLVVRFIFSFISI